MNTDIAYYKEKVIYNVLLTKHWRIFSIVNNFKIKI